MASDEVTNVSAPGRLILFGEHSVDLGGPSVAVAVEPRAVCKAQLAPRFTVNGEDLDPARHPFVRASVLHGWPDMDRPLALTVESRIPPGLGGEASMIVACLGAMSMLQDNIIYEHVARNAFLAYCEARAGRDPLDTSAATHGGCVMVGPEAGENRLWTIGAGSRDWHVAGLDPEGVELVLGYPGSCRPQDVRGKVARYCARNSFARDILRDLGELTVDGFAALECGNLGKAGELMNRSQRLLANLGASDPSLDRLLAAVSKHSHGAKVAGYDGGMIVALAREPEKVIAAIGAAGGRASRVAIASEGVRPED